MYDVGVKQKSASSRLQEGKSVLLIQEMVLKMSSSTIMKSVEVARD